MKDDQKGTQSLVVNGDFGLLLNYCVVPSTDEVWIHRALDEVVRRHGDECPKHLFVDCNCCNGELHEGDTIHIHGHTSDFTQKVRSMEMDHKRIDTARPGDDIGISVIDHAREHDSVYLVT